jgi:NAD(P)-dependent dehydrogenase (short-subunit alcohol dehydrogenase family)
VGDDRDTELADTLAEVGRRVGQTLTDALERVRPAFDALAEVASRPEVQAVFERAEKTLRRRPCLCFCSRAHPADRGVCEVFDAVITGQYSSDWLGDIDVPLCAPCAAARASGRELLRRPGSAVEECDDLG